MPRAFAQALLAALLLATSAMSSSLQSQEQRRGAELTGRVFLSGDTIGLAGVSLGVVELGISTITSVNGFYRLTGLTPGNHVLRARKVGYQSLTLELALRDDRATQRDFRLEPLATVLTEVRIEGELRNVPPRFLEVYRRMATANGKFFTREDIQNLNPPDIQSLLMRVPTVRVNAQGVQFARCNEGGALLLSPEAGKVQIYIDGLRMTGRVRDKSEENAIAAEQREVLRRVNPSQIQAIEIYSGVSRIPGQFLEDACAVIAIWTRSY